MWKGVDHTASEQAGLMSRTWPATSRSGLFGKGSEIHRYEGAIDSTCAVAGQECDHFSHLAGLDKALHAATREHRVYHLLPSSSMEPLLFGQLVLDQGRPHPGGPDGVDGQSQRCSFQSGSLHETKDGMFCGHVRALVRLGDKTRCRGSDDNPASRACNVRPRMLHGKKRTFDHDIH